MIRTGLLMHDESYMMKAKIKLTYLKNASLPEMNSRNSLRFSESGW